MPSAFRTQYLPKREKSSKEVECVSDRIDIKINIKVSKMVLKKHRRFGYITLLQSGENHISYLVPTSVHMHVPRREKSRKEVVYRIGLI